MAQEKSANGVSLDDYMKAGVKEEVFKGNNRKVNRSAEAVHAANVASAQDFMRNIDDKKLTSIIAEPAKPQLLEQTTRSSATATVNSSKTNIADTQKSQKDILQRLGVKSRDLKARLEAKPSDSVTVKLPNESKLQAKPASKPDVKSPQNESPPSMRRR